MHKAKILIVQTGHAIDPILTACGDFDDYFLRAIRPLHPENKVNVDVFPVIDIDERPPQPENYQGIITTGSASMLEENLSWMQKSLDFTNRCLDKRIPLFGVCFGHQLLGAACGSEVGPNPKGRANGTVEVVLKKNTAIGLPRVGGGLDSHLHENDQARNLAVQVSHRDIILTKSSHFNVIGTAPHDPHHFIKAGDCAWGLQFHPEWNKTISEMYIDLRRDILMEEMGKDAFDKMRSTVVETPEANALIAQFITYCRER